MPDDTPDDTETALHRLAAADAPALLVVAALLAAEPGDLLTRAAAAATTTRERQLVAIARAHLDGDAERCDAFVRDHLAEHPDSVLAAWIGARR
ncbi:hypothetical protein [Dactylosporangium sp. CS-033363]|uniref:hypothetical protein n=1 Tax=Dactylosporangium sp. CS-033363 TaxID=3239935 RepID=UPI003D8B75D1